MMTENDKELSDPLLAPINSDDEEPSGDDRSLTPVMQSKISRRPPGYKMGSYSETVKGDGEWHILTGRKSLPDGAAWIRPLTEVKYLPLPQLNGEEQDTKPGLNATRR